MPTTVEHRLPSGHKHDEASVNADASTLGDVFTSVDDGAGGKVAQWSSSPIDPGVSTGTPGNWVWTLIGGVPAIVRGVGAPAAEPDAFKILRRYVNTNNSAKLRIQLGNHRASGDGVEACVMYSLDGGATALLDAGVSVRLDRINYPEPGAYLALTGAALGDNVLLGLGLKGGDGDTVVKIANVVIESVSAASPPDSPSGDPPPVDGDLPTGGAFGVLVLDQDAMALVLSDNDPVTEYTDQTASANHGAPISGQSPPTYKANGAGTGKPSVRFTAGSTTGLAYDVPASGSQTRYIVMVPTTGFGAGGRSFDNGVVISQHGASNIKDIGLGLRADGKLALSIGENGVATTFRSSVTASAYTGAIHLLCIVYSEPGGSGDLYVDDMSTPVGGVFPLDGGAIDDYPTELMGLGGSAISVSIGADYCRNTCWDAAHGPAQRAAVKAILQAIWGTP